MRLTVADSSVPEGPNVYSTWTPKETFAPLGARCFVNGTAHCAPNGAKRSTCGSMIYKHLAALRPGVSDHLLREL